MTAFSVSFWVVSLTAIFYTPGLAGINPGFKARITTHGLDYANKVAVNSLVSYMKTARIPDQTGESSGVHYSIYSMTVTQFTPPTSALKLAPGQGLSWVGSGAGLSIHGKFKYKKGIIRGSGSLDVTVSSLKFSIAMIFGVDSEGRPKISAGQCSSDIGKLSLKFHGGQAWIYNLFRNTIASKLKKAFNPQICKMVKMMIDVDAEEALQKLPVTAVLDKVFLLNYSLVATPRFTGKYMETNHSGEIYWKGDVTECPLVAPSMPPVPDTGRMLYLWLSDYVFNTLGFVAQKHGFLHYNVTSRDLPSGNKGFLNTTCEKAVCIGSIIPQIGKRYPNSIVELELNSTMAPSMKIDKGTINITCGGDIQMFARPKGAARAFLLSLNTTMSAIVEARMSDQLLYGKVQNLKFSMSTLKSDVGPIPLSAMTLIELAVKGVLVPKLNDLGARGFPLPMTKQITLANTALTLVQDSMVIATDLTYKSAAPDKSRPLKYLTADRFKGMGDRKLVRSETLKGSPRAMDPSYRTHW